MKTEQRKIKMSEKEAERRAELEKYYEKVLTCVSCGKKYGSDNGEGDNKRCPVCCFYANGSSRCLR